ncbi:FAD-binding-3 domain-containing protein [Mycena sanguinolenta]|uniref:FAD-binding-3 domain-containing protein n=1 Tax=Mycena sanguinolenta TaxID=230812 RepID=A0A8H7DDU0_9AGAR|nr:FAD-binding-3 domain-containing protein [Mycena sanguinolenta]
MTTAGLSFIIIGASVSGLASAISLKRSGHSVLILEKDAQLGGAASILNGCARVCPNGSKILLDWGLLDAETKAKAAPMPGFAFFKYNAGYSEGSEPDFLGEHRWYPELLFEARGGYMQFRHHDFMRILYDEAMRDSSSRVSVRFGAEVVKIDCEACSVTLRSGEIHTADAIIGADGARGIVRRTLMREEGVSLDRDVPIGVALYRDLCMRMISLLGFYEYDDIGSTVFDMGRSTQMRAQLIALPASFCSPFVPFAAAWIFPVGRENDLALSLYTPDATQDGTWTEEPEKNINDVIGPCDIRLKKLASLAGPTTCVQLKKPYALESWVSKSGRVVVLGEAAHPSPTGGLHPYAVALEDAVFIGKIFSHTRDRGRVPEFLYAFQEQREKRCARIREIDLEYVEACITPLGPMHDQRDAGMRANHAAGKNAMEGDFQQMLDDFGVVFGYSAADDADEWWINWGRFRNTNTENGNVEADGRLRSTSFISITTNATKTGNQ